jgi:hypothetical protein
MVRSGLPASIKAPEQQLLRLLDYFKQESAMQHYREEAPLIHIKVDTTGWSG